MTEISPAFFPSSFGPFTDSSPTSFAVGNALWKSLVDQKPLSFQNQGQNNGGNKDLFETVKESPKVHLLASLDDSHGLEFVSELDEFGNTLLHLTTEQNNEFFIQQLIDQEVVDVNAQNFAGETALFIAAKMGFDRIVRFLILHGANPNFSDLEGTTPAHIAAACGRVDVLLTLATYGAWLNVQDDVGDSPLHYGVRESQEKVVEFLVQNCRVNVDLENEDLESPLQLALCLEETAICRILAAHSSKENTVSRVGY